MRASQAGIGAIPDGTNHLSIPHGSRNGDTSQRAMDAIWENRDRYYVTRDGVEREVSGDEFIAAEQEAGFYPKPGLKFATNSFGTAGISGRRTFAYRIKGL